MSSPTISVIVPVYNVAALLPRCIDSLLAQNFADYEVLLVDDEVPMAAKLYVTAMDRKMLV